MKPLAYYLYNIIGVPVQRLGFAVGALLNTKIRHGIRERKHLFQNLEKRFHPLEHNSPRFWIHNSSMGEFEQTKPLVLKLRERFPECLIVVSFFSPSGLMHVKECKGADYLCYLPFDSIRQAKRFVHILRPDVAIVVRHDFWPNHLWQLNRNGVPVVLVNCSTGTRPAHSLFSKIFQRFLHHFFDVILTVSDKSKKYCEEHRLGKKKIETVGDTRYDQVMQRAKDAEKIVAPLQKIKKKRRCFVAGSTWPADENIIFEALNRLDVRKKKLWVLLVPHEPTEVHIEKIANKLSETGLTFCRFTELQNSKSNNCDVLLVDQIGTLASLYALCDLAYVGGGFGQGIHSVLEPAAFGKVVLFGPKCHNSYEAGQLIKNGVGFSVRTSDELYHYLDTFFTDPVRLKEMGKIVEQIVMDNIGAAERIVKRIEGLVRML